MIKPLTLINHLSITNMKKFVLSSLIGFALSVSTFAASFSVTVIPGTCTNIWSPSFNQGSLLVKQFIITSVTATNSTLAIYDMPTNNLQFTNAAYTNTVSYATNGVIVWTNFYGVVQSNNYEGGTLLTNWWLVDITNNVVGPTTNNYPIRVYAAAGANNTTIYGPTSGNQNGFYFLKGIWATNTGSGTCSLTIIY